MKYLCELVVLTWNKIDVTKKFVESLYAHTKVPTRVIFVDNASHDGTREYLTGLKNTDTLHFKIVLNEKNEGYIKGNNQGLALTEAPYVCIANNDIIVTPGWIEEMVHIFEKNPEIGLLNPNSNNLAAAVPENKGIDDFAAELRQKYHGVVWEMPFCIGFYMMLKREVLDKVKGYSEEFLPMFFEDTDLSLRVRQAGYKLGVAKASYVWHKEHASIDLLGPEKEQIFLKSKAVYLKKWGHHLRLAWVVKSKEELMRSLNEGIDLVREGNFLHFYVKGLKMHRDIIFKENGSLEMTDVKFIYYGSVFDLVWKLLIKKKKFDLTIWDNKLGQFVLKLFGQPCSLGFDRDLIKQVKYKGI